MQTQSHTHTCPNYHFRHTHNAHLVAHIPPRTHREGKANGTIQDAHKFALWQELKVTSFTRAMAAAWCLPVVDLLLRCQLSVLGRHLYYAARTGGGHHRCVF